MLVVCVPWGPLLHINRRFFHIAVAKPSPVLIAPTHGGTARLSGPEWLGKYRDGRPAKGSRQSDFQY